jgi:hypothetical protein
MRHIKWGSTKETSASKAALKKLEPTHNRGIRFALGVFAVCRTDNALCEAGVSTFADMGNLNTTFTAIIFISNPNHPIRPFCLLACQTSTITDLIMNFVQSDEAQATIDSFQAETFRILNEQYEHHSKI